MVVASSRDFWLATVVAAWASAERRALFDGAERALLLRFPFGVEAGVSAAALAAAARVRRRFAMKVPPPGLCFSCGRGGLYLITTRVPRRECVLFGF